MAKHPHVLLLHLHGEEIEIDSEMVVMINALWNAGYDTRFCCQGEPPGTDGPWSKPGYISFPRDDGLRLLDQIEIRELMSVCESVESRSCRGESGLREDSIILRFPYRRVKDLENLLLSSVA